MKSHLPLAVAPVAPEKTQDRPSCGRSNAERAEKLTGRGGGSEKALGKGWEGGMLASLGEEQRPLGALRAAFGPRVDGLRIEEGKSIENEKIGAEAHAEGSVVRLSENITIDDPELMGVLAHEVAHALAPQGQAEELDQPGDPGEVKAEVAGSRFEAWAKLGFEGPAPQLQPATGGRARIQRSQGEDAPATEAPTEESWLDQTLGGLSRGYQFQRDLRLALGEVPLHAAGVLGETLELIWEHLDAFMLTLGIFWGLEAGVGLLTAAPDPSFVTKGLAVLLQGILLLFLGFGVVVEAAQAVMYGWEGMKKAWEAEGDPQKISEASVAFCRMLLHAVLAVLAILALRGGVGRGLTGVAGKGRAAAEGSPAKGGVVAEGAAAKGGSTVEGATARGGADELVVVEEEAVAARLGGKEDVPPSKSEEVYEEFVEPPFEVQAVKPKTRGPAEKQLGSKGMSEPVALTREELARVRTWEAARNSYLKRWREVDTSPYPKEVAELLGPEGSVRKAMTPDDLAAVIKEKRGVEIAKKEGGYFNHLKEYWQASKNLKARMADIQDLLKKFPAESEEGMILREKLGDLSRLLDLYESTI